MTVRDADFYNGEIGRVIDGLDEAVRPAVERPREVGEPVLLVAGALNAGKSSLLNDLLRSRLLPDERPVTDTRVYSRICRGLAADAQLRMRDGSIRPLELDEAVALMSKAAGDDPRLSVLDRVEVRGRVNELPSYDVEDSPGHSDAAVDGQHVRQDILERSRGSTAVLYLIDGSALVQDSDRALLRALHDARVPIIVAFSRWDLVEEDEEDVDPRADRVESLTRNGLAVAVENVHFVSSYLNRRGDSGSVDGLRAGLGLLENRTQSLQERRRLRSVSAYAASAMERLQERIDAIEYQHARERTREEIRGLRVAGRSVRVVEIAHGELGVSLRRAASAVRNKVEQACQGGSTTVQTDYDSKWSKELTTAWSTAVSAFLVTLGTLPDVERLAMSAPMAPTIPFVSESESPKWQDLSELAPDEMIAKLGAKALAAINRARFVRLNTSRVDEACGPLMTDTMSAAESWLELANEAVGTHHEHVLESADEEREKLLASGRRALRRLSSIREEVDVALQGAH